MVRGCLIFKNQQFYMCWILLFSTSTKIFLLPLLLPPKFHLKLSFWISFLAIFSGVPWATAILSVIYRSTIIYETASSGSLTSPPPSPPSLLLLLLLLLLHLIFFILLQPRFHMKYVNNTFADQNKNERYNSFSWRNNVVTYEPQKFKIRSEIKSFSKM